MLLLLLTAAFAVQPSLGRLRDRVTAEEWYSNRTYAVDTKSDAITASYTVLVDNSAAQTYLLVSTRIVLDAATYVQEVDALMYAQLLQGEEGIMSSFTCTTFLPKDVQPIQTAYVVNSYVGGGEFAAQSGNWFNLLAGERAGLTTWKDDG